MKLINLQIHSNGKNGLESEVLLFGQHVTQLYGPNGCGKTPTVQSISFCLGYPSVFREEIYRRCSKAVLTFSVESSIYEVSRVFSSDTDITVKGPLGQESRFYSEADYSEFMFELLKISYPNLVSSGDTKCKPYISSILPLFYLDQDKGYSDLYSPPTRFIKDQFSEMVRLTFDLPVKNSFDAKKDRIDMKKEVSRLDELVKTRQRDLEFAQRNISEIENVQIIDEKIAVFERELTNLKFSGSQRNDAVAVVDRFIAETAESIRAIETDLREIEKRERSVNRIIEEINIEINALSLNEESRRVFLSFNEICESPACQLFSVSSAAYAKNLLYLKDQIKDLDRNSESDRMRIGAMQSTRRSLLVQNERLQSEREVMLLGSEMGAIVDAISKIKNEIFELQTKKADIEKVNILQSRYFEALVTRKNALDKYEDLGSDRSSNPDLIRIRVDFRSLFLKWLDVINTDNINRNISFKDDFQPIFGVEGIGQLKGSTKVRAVLAFHAALLELTLVKGRALFRFLILDTPKQHDINNTDLGAYVHALKRLAEKFEVQIIFSNTEFHYEGDKADAEWIPHFPGEKHKMFYRVTP